MDGRRVATHILAIHHPITPQLQQLKRRLEAQAQATHTAEQRVSTIVKTRDEALQSALRAVERLESEDTLRKQQRGTLSTHVQRLEHTLQHQQRATDVMEQLQQKLDTTLKEQQQYGVLWRGALFV